MHDGAEISERLKAMLRQVAPDLEALSPAEGATMLESTGAETEQLRSCLDAVHSSQPLPPEAQHILEAIVLPRFRPALHILNDDFDRPGDPWQHLDASENRQRIQRAIPSVGRLEHVGSSRRGYAGTGFVVGPGLIMTNRHVAETFATGLGERGLAFRPLAATALDFKQEFVPTPPELHPIDRIVMIHPCWDLALLHSSGLPANREPLRLSVADPESLLDRDIVVIGYPAPDENRNSLALQQEIFGSKLTIKRLQPGVLRARRELRHYGHSISALTHDASTLGGNSGSAVIDVSTGCVVGLHFGGKYLDANYAVPAYELARDARVVQAGVQFDGTLPTTTDWAAVWRLADNPPSATVPSPQTERQPNPFPPPTNQTVSVTIPLTITITLGTPQITITK